MSITAKDILQMGEEKHTSYDKLIKEINDIVVKFLQGKGVSTPIGVEAVVKKRLNDERTEDIGKALIIVIPRLQEIVDRLKKLVPTGYNV